MSDVDAAIERAEDQDCRERTATRDRAILAAEVRRLREENQRLVGRVQAADPRVQQMRREYGVE